MSNNDLSGLCMTYSQKFSKCKTTGITKKILRDLKEEINGIKMNDIKNEDTDNESGKG